MTTLLVMPKDEKELKLIQSLLEKMKVRNKILTPAQKEDLGLLLLMSKVNRSQKVSRSTVMRKLR